MTHEDQQKFIELAKKARYNEAMNELTTFVCNHAGEGFSGPDAERMADDFALLAAWIYDRLNGENPREKRSMTNKIRKALGYAPIQ
jgi:hypothetical protein